MNNWRRKHDLVVTNGFSNSSKSETTAPNCSLDQYVSAESICRRLATTWFSIPAWRMSILT